MASVEEEKISRNFKNLTIALQKTDGKDTTCQCSNYFNMDKQIEHVDTCVNSPTTVKNTASDTCTYGTLYPNRIFAGSLPGKVNASDLADFFRVYGTVLEGKVVLDSFGRSRRFGFVTFTTQEDVQNVLSQKNIMYKGKKINVGPAVKKMFGTEFSPPESPDTLSFDESFSPSSTSSENPDLSRIVTVPPVNEKKDGGHTGNVWLKVNIRPKLVPKTREKLKILEKNLTTLPPRMMYQFQPMAFQPFVYPTVYTMPAYQPYNNYEPVYVQQQQQPMCAPQYIQQMLPPFQQQWPQMCM